MPLCYDEKTGKIKFGSNPAINEAGKSTGPDIPSYIIWDNRWSAPSGFGV